jgi:hypothetical protein
MNKAEAFVHGLVGDYPWLKDPVVRVYQALLSIVPTEDCVRSETI